MNLIFSFKVCYGNVKNYSLFQYDKGIILFKFLDEKIECKQEKYIKKAKEIIKENLKFLEEYSEILKANKNLVQSNTEEVDTLELWLQDKKIYIDNKRGCGCSEHLIKIYENVKKSIIELGNEIFKTETEELLNSRMQVTAIKMFIYWLMSFYTGEEQCLKTVLEKISLGIRMIEEKSLEEWDNFVRKHFKSIHPSVTLHNSLMTIDSTNYKERLYSIYDIISKFNVSESTNYDLVNSITCDSDIERFALRIYYSSKTIKELESIDSSNLSDKEKLMSKFAIGIKYYYGDFATMDYKKAYDIFYEIKDELIEAKYMIGLCYYYGNGVDKDNTKAFEYFSSIMRKSLLAEHMVAVMYRNGKGIEQDYEKAFEIFTQIRKWNAYYENLLADFYLGEMYFYGLGVDEDKEKGLELMEKAFKSEYFIIKYEKKKKILEDYYKYKYTNKD